MKLAEVTEKPELLTLTDWAQMWTFSWFLSHGPPLTTNRGEDVRGVPEARFVMESPALYQWAKGGPKAHPPVYLATIPVHDEPFL